MRHRVRAAVSVGLVSAVLVAVGVASSHEAYRCSSSGRLFGTILTAKPDRLTLRVSSEAHSLRRYRNSVAVIVVVGRVAVLRGGIATSVSRLTAGDLATVSVGWCPKLTARHITAIDGIHHVRHVVIVMQENRSFDSYFGTYPGADGIPMANGTPTVCAPDPQTGECVKPYHDTSLVNIGGPHAASDAVADIDGGKMDGFVREARAASAAACAVPNAPNCAAGAGPDTMGYHTAAEIPNYWAYARNFVLQDHMFEPNLGWSLPAHLFMVSAWSATCSNPADPMSCVTNLEGFFPQGRLITQSPWNTSHPTYGWTDLTYLLHHAGVSWAYYVAPGSQPDCGDDHAIVCPPVNSSAVTPSIWNPLPNFVTVAEDGQLANVQSSANFFTAAAAGTLPSVSWIVPNGQDSEHPGGNPMDTISDGQAWVTSIVNAVGRGPDWGSTAIFVSWDDWGGFYDHVVPPQVDGSGYGLRVPGLLISPFAKRGLIDHQTLSFDAYLKFIEDDFLNGQRLDPLTDGRPDPRPSVREDEPILGNLRADFDFTQAPRPPLILPERP